MALLPRYALQCSGFGPKKILAPIFFENFDILFSKAETARPDAPGKKIDLAPHSMLCLTSKYEEKFYFRSIETIFVPRWGLKRLLGPQKPFLALIFQIEASISEFFTVFVAAKGAKCIPIHSVL